MQAFVIPTGSMEDTLLIGDHLLVDKLAYAPAGPVIQIHAAVSATCKRGDIIVFRYPGGYQADLREARASAFRATTSGWRTRS